MSATSSIDEAYRRCTATSDRYQWVAAFVLDAMATVACDNGSADSGRVVQALASLAARCDMAEFVVRAHLHRWRLGDATALEAARLLAKGLDNPALQQALNAP